MSAATPFTVDLSDQHTCCNYGSCKEMENNVTPNISAAKGKNQDDCTTPNEKQVVCTSCQHLYKSSEVVLTPGNLCNDHKTFPNISNNSSKSVPEQPRTWKARRYDGMCGCAEANRDCNCNENNQNKLHRYLQLSAGTCWGPRMKKTLLGIAAVIPFVFLIVYLVFTYL